MVYLVATINEQAFAAIRKSYPQYVKLFPSISLLNNSIIKDDLPSEVDTIVVVTPVLEKSMDSSDMKNLSITLKAVRPNIKVIAVYMKQEVVKKYGSELEKLFSNVVYYNFPGSPQISQFGDLLQAKKEELVEENQESSLAKKIGILGVDPRLDNFMVASSIAYLVSKRVRGKVALMETPFSSSPQICNFFGDPEMTSCYKEFVSSGKFDFTKLSFLTSNFGLGAVDSTLISQYRTTPAFIKAIRGLDYAFIDLGTNLKILEQKEFIKDFDEVWIILTPNSKTTSDSIKTMVPSYLKDKVGIILNQLDEYTAFKVQAEGTFKDHLSNIICQIPALESNWISRSQWEKNLLPQIQEYFPIMSTILSPVVKKVI